MRGGAGGGAVGRGGAPTIPGVAEIGAGGLGADNTGAGALGAACVGAAGATGLGGGTVKVGRAAELGVTSLGGGGGTDGAGGGADCVSFGGTRFGRATGAGVSAVGAGACLPMMALSTSPGLEMFERSIFVLKPPSFSGWLGRDVLAELFTPEPRSALRTLSASKSSSELECVFFSVTPASANTSRIALLLTSSSRARSLIRILLIRPFVPPGSAKSSCQPHGSGFVAFLLWQTRHVQLSLVLGRMLRLFRNLFCNWLCYYFRI
jgi:hypothetical protein